MQQHHAPTAEDFAFSRLIAYAAYQWPGYTDAHHHRLIARALEAVERGEIKRLMINMPPRHGKSMLASEFFPAWYIGRNPNKYIVTATYAQDLADDFGRKVKNQIEDEAFKAIFPGVGLADDSKSSKRFHIEGSEGGLIHHTAQKGAFYAVGVGGPLTGRGAHLLLIDDPVKNREEAESEVMRRKIKDWFTSTAYTRLMPGGAIVVIQCMVGSTQVLMGDGRQSYLKDVRPGDLIATYEGGRLSTARVLNWANKGPDNCFTITTTSGTTVTANARHPFLVERDGVRTWVRLKNLAIGDLVVRATGENGEARRAPMKAATSPFDAKGIATAITTKPAGPREFGPHHLTQKRGEQPIFATAMASTSTNTTQCTNSRAADALSAENCPARTSAPTGAASCASTIATIAARSEGCCAMTATLQSDMARPKQPCSQPLDTYEITLDAIVSIAPAGAEDVFDIQVERTENFIANGLVSHNTRWHEDDLSGWLRAEHAHEGWTVLDLPAISDEGTPLWPEQYDLPTLEKIRQAVGPRDWSALYQQRPSPESGDYFKREWIREVETMPDREELYVYGGSDYAVTSKGGDFTVHAVLGIDRAGDPWLLDLWRQQTASDVWVEAFCDLVIKWKPVAWAEENGQIKSGVGPFLLKRQIERGAYVAREQFATRGDKGVRAQSIRGRIATRGLRIPMHAPWKADLISEMMHFPVGVHDDQVDALGLVGQLIDKMSTKAPTVAPQPKHVVRTLGDVIAPPLAVNRRR